MALLAAIFTNSLILAKNNALIACQEAIIIKSYCCEEITITIFHNIFNFIH